MATVDYNTQAQATNLNGFQPGAGDVYGFSFTAAATGTLSQLNIGLYNPNNSTGTYQIEVYSSANNQPGTEISTTTALNDNAISSANAGNYQYNLGNTAPLTSGTRYFIEFVQSAASNLEFVVTSNTGGTGSAGEYIDYDGTVVSNASQGEYTFAEVQSTCYASGTLIRTTRGDVAVETLAVGDLAVTAAGEHRPIRWLGHQTHRLGGPPRPRSSWPVRVAAGAFGPNRPDRDLYLSPGHSVCLAVIDEVLVPIQDLVNGATIAYVEDLDQVTYWHVELDSHDVLLANNLPAESFLEMGANRTTFVEGRGLGDPPAEALARTHADFCRRFVDGGPLLATLRDELRGRAARLGWCPSRAVAIRCETNGQTTAPHVTGGEALFSVPGDPGELRIVTGLDTPALRGPDDPRRLGVAVYAIAVRGADGDERRLDLDDPVVAGCFHSGERTEGRAYRWSAGDIVLPPSFTAGLPGPLLLRLVFEPSTVRGWIAPEPVRERPRLRVAA